MALAFAVTGAAFAAEGSLGAGCTSKAWGKQAGGFTCAEIATGKYAYVRLPGSTAATTVAPKATTGAFAGKTSRKNPGPLRMSQTLKDADNGDFDVVVDGYLADGTAAVKAANQFNDPAGAGMRYGIVHLTVTYHEGKKTDKATPAVAIEMAVFGAAATERSRCYAVVPEPFEDSTELFDGGKVSGNVCFVMPVADATGPLVLRVAESFCITNCDEAWFKLQ